MSFNLSLDHQELYGLFEINPQGIIRYCRIRKNNSLLNTKPLWVGCNLFSEILLFDNAGEFKDKFGKFCQAEFPTESFLFDFKLHKKIIQSPILFVRLNNNSFPQINQFFIVDIRKSMYQSSTEQMS